jgi:hypothetical protein
MSQPDFYKDFGPITLPPSPIRDLLDCPVRIFFYDEEDEGQVVGECRVTGQLSLVAQAIQFCQTAPDYHLDATAAELVAFLGSHGFQIAENIMHARLHDLRKLAVVSNDLPKRPCLVTGRMKKVWMLLPTATVLRFDPIPAGPTKSGVK